MGLSLDDIWGTASDVVTSPGFWGGITGQQAAQAPGDTTIIYQTPTGGAAPAKDYTPWLIGGAVVIGVGALAWAMTRPSASAARG
jgi:hypothetical protein